MAATGRTSALNALNRARTALLKLRRDWEAHIQALPVEPAISTLDTLYEEAVPLEPCLLIVHQEAKAINRRIRALEARNIQLTPFSDEEVYRDLINSRRSTETPEWRLKRSMPHVADSLKDLKNKLIWAERIISDAIAMFWQNLQDIHQVEMSALFKQAIEMDEQCKRFEILAGEEAKPELLSACARMHRIRNRQEQEQDHMILILLRGISDRGVKIARQTQITEFFRPVGGG